MTVAVLSKQDNEAIKHCRQLVSVHCTQCLADAMAFGCHNGMHHHAGPCSVPQQGDCDTSKHGYRDWLAKFLGPVDCALHCHHQWPHCHSILLRDGKTCFMISHCNPADPCAMLIMIAGYDKIRSAHHTQIMIAVAYLYHHIVLFPLNTHAL